MLRRFSQRESRHRQRFTRLGFHFLFVATFAMLGGALRGFNLLLVLAGLLIGAMLVQWRWSRRSLDSMGVQRRMPTESFAGEPFTIRYLLRNHSRLLPAWMIRVEDRIESMEHDIHSAAVSAAGMIPAGRTLACRCECLILRRGRYRFGPMQLITTFPFSLRRSARMVDSAVEFRVFPKILVLQPGWAKRLRSRGGGVATTVRRSGHAEGDFFGLRQWQTGDSRKWIHWRTTARIHELAVRQFEQQRRYDLGIMVDGFVGVDPELVETTISLAASVLVKLMAYPSNRLVVASAGQVNDVVIGGGSDRGKRKILEILADLAPAPKPCLGDAVVTAHRIAGSAQDVVVISPRSRHAAEQDNPELAAALSSWVRRGALLWIDVSQDLESWVVTRQPVGNLGKRPSSHSTSDLMKASASSSAERQPSTSGTEGQQGEVG